MELVRNYYRSIKSGGSSGNWYVDINDFQQQKKISYQHPTFFEREHCRRSCVVSLMKIENCFFNYLVNNNFCKNGVKEVIV